MGGCDLCARGGCILGPMGGAPFEVQKLWGCRPCRAGKQTDHTQARPGHSDGRIVAGLVYLDHSKSTNQEKSTGHSRGAGARGEGRLDAERDARSHFKKTFKKNILKKPT